MVWQIPGDTSLIRELRIAADSRARCVLVVEKDSVFRRLHNDGLHRRLPCVLITGCGFPDLATRTLVQHVVRALGVRAFVLTDYNPHGREQCGENPNRCPTLPLRVHRVAVL